MGYTSPASAGCLHLTAPPCVTQRPEGPWDGSGPWGHSETQVHACSFPATSQSGESTAHGSHTAPCRGQCQSMCGTDEVFLACSRLSAGRETRDSQGQSFQSSDTPAWAESPSLPAYRFPSAGLCRWVSPPPVSAYIFNPRMWIILKIEDKTLKVMRMTAVGRGGDRMRASQPLLRGSPAGLISSEESWTVSLNYHLNTGKKLASHKESTQRAKGSFQ